MRDTEEVIVFRNVGKKFKKGRKLLLKEALVDIFSPGKTETFWALRDLNFSVQRGESVGIIGANGSGKSTILKLIAGVMYPDVGKVHIQGKIAPLIELGAGFHPELSGRENIYLNGAILGLSRKEVDERFDDIVKFAELEEFVDTPVKHYSSGMYMRLAFAIAVHTEPDILLIDEILAVGDQKFQSKCMRKMKEFQKNGVTIVFVSHNMRSIENFCGRAIYIKDGKIEAFGGVKMVVDLFIKDFDINKKQS